MFALAPTMLRRNCHHPYFPANLLPAILILVFSCLIGSRVHAQTTRPAVHKVPPTYPQIARQAGITGSVVVMATVDPSGKVVKADVTTGNKVFTQAAIDAVKQWKFAPGAGTDILIVSVDFNKQ